MMSTADLKNYLDPLGLGAWRYFPSVGSTNDIAQTWSREGAPDWSLVVADTQTAGRGRGNRCWVTEPESGLALSIILRPSPNEIPCFPRFTALAALGLIKALYKWNLSAEIKWPNDILLAGKKVAGVLVEADWESDRMDAVVIGLGVNVLSHSVPPLGSLRYPATAVETALGRSVDRWSLMASILRMMQEYRAILHQDAFIDAWNAKLAFKGEWVRFLTKDGELQTVRLVGVSVEGYLVLEHQNGVVSEALSGEILITANKP